MSRFVGIRKYDELKPFITEKSFPENTVYSDSGAVLSTTKIRFVCPDCSNDFSLNAMTAVANRRNLCPYCNGRKKTENSPKKLYRGKVSLFDDDPNDLVSEWSSKNDFSPKDVSRSSGVQVVWECRDCGFEWITTVNKRKAGRGCPKCLLAKPSGKNFVDDGDYHDYNVGKFYPEILKYWIDERSPYDHKPKTKKKFKLKCEYGYVFLKEPSRFVGTKFRCPECHKNTPKNFTVEKSFKNNVPEELLGELIDPEIDPEMIFAKSGKKVLWRCSTCGHEWRAYVYSRVYGCGCPKCSKKPYSKQEKELAEFLKQYFPDLVENDYTVLGDGELDIYIPSKSIAIEYNGLYWHLDSLKQNKNVHHDKWRDCRDKGIQIDYCLGGRVA